MMASRSWPPALRMIAGAFSALGLTLAFFVAPAVGWFTENRDQVPSHWDPFDPLDLKAPSTIVQRWKIGQALDDGGLCQ